MLIYSFRPFKAYEVPVVGTVLTIAVLPAKRLLQQWAGILAFISHGWLFGFKLRIHGSVEFTF